MSPEERQRLRAEIDRSSRLLRGVALTGFGAGFVMGASIVYGMFSMGGL